jgi:hypothetical protein
MNSIDDPQLAERAAPLAPKTAVKRARATLKAGFPKRKVDELRAAMKDAYQLLAPVEAALGGGGPVDPPPPPPVDPVDPPPVDPGSVDVSTAGWDVVANRTFKGAQVKAELDGTFKKRAYVNCTFQDYAGGSLLHGRLGSGIRFINCRFLRMKATRGVHGTLLFFPGSHWATSDDDYGLAWINCIFEDCAGSDLIEFKCSGSRVINCRFIRCKGGIRIRHGARTWVINCTGLSQINVRCGPHIIANCPDAVVWLFQGNLPWENWQSQHDHGGGFERQAAGRCQVVNCKLVVVGKEDGNAKGYPATNNNIAPTQKVTYGKGDKAHTGTTFEPVKVPSLKLAA